MFADFDVSVVNRNGHAVVVVIGEVDLSAEEQFRNALLAAQHASTDVIVDLTGVTFIDSTGIRTLVGARVAQADGSRLRVLGARRSVQRVFEITGVDRLLMGEAADG